MLKQRIISSAIALIAALLIAAPVVAQDSDESVPTSCWTEPRAYDKVGKTIPEYEEDGTWFVEVIDGPCPVPCPTDLEPYLYMSSYDEELACNVGNALCTGILYGVTTYGEADTDLVGILAQGPIPPEFEEGFALDKCEGDPYLLDLGVNSCHEQLITFENADDEDDGGEYDEESEESPSWDFTFAVVAEGNRDISTTTVAVAEHQYGMPSARALVGTKDNGYGYYEVEYCTIKGLGRQIPDSCVPACGNFNANQTITKTEVLDFKGCKIEFVFDLTTGAVLSAGPYQGEPSPPDCKFSEFGIGDLEVDLPYTNDPEQRKATFGQALVSAGTESCSCRVIGGRVYCWGKNCPQ